MSTVILIARVLINIIILILVIVTDLVLVISIVIATFIAFMFMCEIVKLNIQHNTTSDQTSNGKGKVMVTLMIILIALLCL